MMSTRSPLGHFADFRDDTGALLRRGYAEHGEVFGIRLGPQRTAVVAGPELQRFFFEQTDDTCTMQRVYRYLAAAIGDVAFAAPMAVYERQRPLFHVPLRPSRVRPFVDVMQEEIRQWIATLPAQGTFDLAEVVAPVVQSVSVRCLAGDAFAREAGPDFWEQYRILGESIDPVLPPWLPLPKFRQRDRARMRIEAMLRDVVAETRRGSSAGSDFMAELLETPCGDGRMVSDEEAVSLLLGLIFAGYETTVGQAAWAVIQLLQHQQYQDLLLDDLANAGFSYNALITERELTQPSTLRYAVMETSRMKPSAPVLMRYVEEDLQLPTGHTVPKGWMILISGHLGHYLPDVFSRPFAYDPARFSPERAEHLRDKYSLVGFGAGRHKCPGMHFAELEMALFCMLMLTGLDMELRVGDPGTKPGLSAVRPGPAPTAFKRRPETYAPVGAYAAATA
jgi:sterol 14-demethylase